MTYFEYNEISSFFNGYVSKEYGDEFQLCGCPFIYFCYDFNNESAIIKGRIPFKVIKNMINTYPNFICDAKVETIQYTLEDIKNITTVSNMQDDMGYLNPKYFPSLIINSKELFIILLYKLQQHYINNRYTNIDNTMNVEEIINNINNIMLRKISPVYEERKNAIISQCNNSDIRNLLYKYDCSVNPFLNKQSRAESCDDFKDTVRMTYNMNKNFRDNSKGVFSLTIDDESKNSSTTTFSDMNTLIYQLIYRITETQHFSIMHYYNPFSDNHLYRGELVVIEISDTANGKTINKVFNLTKSLYISNNGVEKMSSEHINELIRELNRATLIATDITERKSSSRGMQAGPHVS